MRTLFQTLLAFPLGLSGLEFNPVKIQIILPTNGSVLHVQRLIGLQTQAEDSDGFITQVEVFAGTSSLAVATSPPFTLAFPAGALTLGTNTLTARATDNWGYTGTSESISVVVLPYTPSVRAVYLIPANRPFNQAYYNAIQGALTNLQAWYASQLANRKSFRLSTPIVEAYVTPHLDTWYTNNPSGYFYNTLSDGFALTGGQLGDPEATWLFYLDADTAGQATGGITGAAVLHRGDLQGLIGQSSQPINRWIGGSGHELGHAFGLPHPPGCESPVPGVTCPSSVLMWLGYITYPNTTLLPANKDILNASPFFYQPTNQIRFLQSRVVSNVFSVTVSLERGWPFDLLQSQDLKTWTSASRFVSTNSEMRILLPPAKANAFFRLQYP